MEMSTVFDFSQLYSSTIRASGIALRPALKAPKARQAA
jgi:hypothetical protein